MLLRIQFETRDPMQDRRTTITHIHPGHVVAIITTSATHYPPRQPGELITPRHALPTPYTAKVCIQLAHTQDRLTVATYTEADVAARVAELERQVPLYNPAADDGPPPAEELKKLRALGCAHLAARHCEGLVADWEVALRILARGGR